MTPEIPRARDPRDVALANPHAPTPTLVCGSVKPISGRAPLRCELAAGHAGDHAVRNALGEWLVRWSH